MERTKRTVLCCICFFIVATAFSQNEVDGRPSPLALATMRYKDAYVKITYSQPDKHGREIFGKLVPYGKVWRTGANEATEITTTRNISLNGFLLKAGTYSIFTIPSKERWTIIINNELGLVGSYNYNSKLDLLRFEVIAQAVTNEVNERFKIQFIQKNETAEMQMLWDNVRIAIPMKFLN